jgi:competence protein ComEC
MPRRIAVPEIVPIGCAFVVGSAGGTAFGPWITGVAAAAMGAIAYALRSRPGPRRGALIVAAALSGAALQSGAWEAASRRMAAWSLEPGAPIDVAAQATVLASAERDVRGERTLALRLHRPDTPESIDAIVSLPALAGDEARRIDALRRGDLVRAWCRVRAPGPGPGVSAAAARRRLASRGFDATGAIKSSRLLRLEADGAVSLGRVIDSARAWARFRLDRTLGPTGRARGLMGAMLLGDRALLDDDVVIALRDAGLAHLLSISGLHAGLAMLLVFAFLRRGTGGAWPMAISGGAILVVFALVTGAGASVLRACVALGATLAGRAVGRDVVPIGALALAAGLLVLAVPALAWSVGFTLSVLATAGLLLLGPRCAAAIPGARSAASAIGISLGAYLATVPVMAVAFGRLSPVALAANLAAAALCALSLASGAATLAIGTLPILGPAVIRAATGSADLLVATARLAAGVPGGHLRVEAPGPVAIGAYLALLLLIRFAPRTWPPGARRTLRFAFTLLLIAFHLGRAPGGSERATVVDVGQGLSVVMERGDGSCVLADAGPSRGGRADAGDRIVIPTLLAHRCTYLPAVALSHDHDDHAGGVAAVLRDLDVGELWIAGGAERDPLTRDAIALAIERGVGVRRLVAGASIVRAGLAIRVVHPEDADRARPLNDRCLVLHARFPSGRTLLLPGDIEAAAERAIVARGLEARADALIAAHHGADGSNTAPWLAAVHPREVIVSAGRGNRFGHPGAAALSRFAREGARVLRTDRDGTIVLDASAGGWRISVERDRHGDEGQDEDDGEQDGERDAPAVEGSHLVVEARVPAPEKEEDEEPEGVRGDRGEEDRLRGDERADGRDRAPRHDSMRPRREGEDRVPPVELSDREEVHRGDEHPDPRCPIDAVDSDVGGAVEQVLQDGRQEGWTEGSVRGGVGRDLDRAEDPDHHHGNGYHEPRDRPGGGDVEERLAGRDPPLDPDHRAEGADEHGDPGDEERKGRRDAVTAARHIVPQLVGQEDGEEEHGVGNPLGQPGGGEVLGPGGVRIESSLPEPAPRHHGGHEGRPEQGEMEPPSRAPLRNVEGGERRKGDRLAPLRLAGGHGGKLVQVHLAGRPAAPTSIARRRPLDRTGCAPERTTESRPSLSWEGFFGYECCCTTGVGVRHAGGAL